MLKICLEGIYVENMKVGLRKKEGGENILQERIVAGVENMLTHRPPMARTGGRINIIF